LLEKWLAEDNIFVKRVCLVSLIELAKKGQQTQLIYKMVLEASSAYPVNDLVAKAAGWLLREAGKADQHLLEKFLEEHGWRLPRVSVRYAIERFPKSKRKYFLDITKKQ
ncbi:MAG: DNA alkylation repair protein, partial [Candidatus Saccharicenans sp.]|nr:DNA alkylation repair protein [Candidatus Saccharicenans sp.]